MSVAAPPRRRGAGRRLLAAASALTTPLLPEDYLGMVNPLWSGRELRGRVEAVHPETADAATVVIRPGRAWAGHHAGQWVRVGLEVDGVRHHRSYSLTSPPQTADGRIAVTVKAVADGRVSEQLVRRTAPGTVVRLEPAEGEFVLPDPCPERILFLTAGSGITPVMGILRALERRAGPRPGVALVHVARTADDVIFGRELRGLAAAGVLRLHELHTARTGRPSPGELLAWVPDWTERETWACGPGALLDGLEARFGAAGVGERLRVERFSTTLLASPGAQEAVGRVSFTRSGHAVDADGATTLLDAGEAVGALLPSGCRMGICRTCVGRLRSGRVRDLRTGEIIDSPGDEVQTCVSAAAGGPVEIEL